MSRFGPVVIRWRAIVFVTALFWFWYLAPAAAQSHTFARVIQLLPH